MPLLERIGQTYTGNQSPSPLSKRNEDRLLIPCLKYNIKYFQHCHYLYLDWFAKSTFWHVIDKNIQRQGRGAWERRKRDGEEREIERGERQGEREIFSIVLVWFIFITRILKNAP